MKESKNVNLPFENTTELGENLGMRFINASADAYANDCMAYGGCSHAYA